MIGALTLSAVGLLFLLRARLRGVQRQTSKGARALAERETRNSAIVKSLPDLLFRLDSEGRFLQIQADENSLVAPSEQLLGHKLDDIDVLPREVAHRALLGVRRVCATGAMDRFEYQLALPTRKAYFEVRFVRLSDTEVLGIARDVTDRKARELTLFETTASLRKSQAELQEYTDAVSHDLRQPLHAIEMYVGLLERQLGDRLDDNGRNFVAVLRDGTKRMDKMLLSLLAYSRAGHSEESREAVDLRLVVDEALRYLTPDLEEAGADIKIKGAWPTIPANREEMLRLFQNLIGNALKYRAAEYCPEITVAAEPDERMCRISIQDNGIGIDPGQADRLFQVFQRLHGPSKYEGMGVGLAICRKIIEGHGGRIWIESDGPGKGCCIRFVLPMPSPATIAAEA